MGEGLSKQGAVARRLLLREVTEIMVTAAIPKQAFSGNGKAGRLAASLENPEAVCWRPMKHGIVSGFLLGLGLAGCSGSGPSQATKTDPPRVEETAPADMVFVRGGTFRMGSDKGLADEAPVHEVTVGS